MITFRNVTNKQYDFTTGRTYYQEVDYILLEKHEDYFKVKDSKNGAIHKLDRDFWQPVLTIENCKHWNMIKESDGE